MTNIQTQGRVFIVSFNDEHAVEVTAGEFDHDQDFVCFYQAGETVAAFSLPSVRSVVVKLDAASTS